MYLHNIKNIHVHVLISLTMLELIYYHINNNDNMSYINNDIHIINVIIYIDHIQ